MPGKILESVFIDTRSELFEMVYDNETGMYVYVSTSPDGFNWTADTQAVIFNTQENYWHWFWNISNQNTVIK